MCCPSALAQFACVGMVIGKRKLFFVAKWQEKIDFSPMWSFGGRVNVLSCLWAFGAAVGVHMDRLHPSVMNTRVRVVGHVIHGGPGSRTSARRCEQLNN